MPYKNAEHRRAYEARHAHKKNLRRSHGLALDQLAALRKQQGNLCYLCGDELGAGDRDVFIDHDHRCCRTRRSCSFCRRGLACNNCNVGIGMFSDDPDRMRRVADALEQAIADVTVRLASKPQQLDLLGL
jgi:Recombination endonuclease VII